MEKLVLKKIRLALNIVAIIMFFVFLGVVYFTEKDNALHILDETIKQIEMLSDQAKLDTESTKKLLEEDYLNRAYAIDYMLKNNEENLNNVTLETIKELMEIESISLLDNTGKIAYSTIKDVVGIDFKELPGSEPYYKMLESSDEKAYVLEWDGYNVVNGGNSLFVAVKSSLRDYSFIRIGLSSDIVEKFTEKNTIESIVRSMPTIEEETYFVFDMNSGEIDSITINNEQDVKFDNVHTQNEYISILKSANEGKFLNINGSIKLLKTKKIDENILGVYYNGDVIFNSILFNSLFLIVFIYILHVCIYFIIKYYLKIYVLKDIYSIESNIKELMDGNGNVIFETKNNTEFKYIMNILNEWKYSYKHKSERMTRIISSIGSHVAVFECIYAINQINFTDNMQSVLGLDNDTWNDIIKSPKGFEDYLKSLMIHSKEDIVSLQNNKFVQINAFSKNNTFYGMIMDKTEDVKELLELQESAEIDSLTNLKNRAALEKYVKKSLEIKPGKGTMLIFDLDNFKRINDALGHPEGDRVLKNFANCLNAFFTSDDIVARIGGDEFVVFMHSNIDTQKMKDKMNSFLKIFQEEFSDYYDRFGFSTSIGIAYVDPQKNYNDLYKCADAGLYEAKKMGKDRFYIVNNELNEMD